MKHKVSELDGALLDAAVAMVEGVSIQLGQEDLKSDNHESGVRGWRVGTRYSSEWADGGPIIERERIALVCTGSAKTWDAYVDGDYVGPDGQVECNGNDDASEGPTPLIAAMRAYVVSRVGDEVDLPSAVGEQA